MRNGYHPVPHRASALAAPDTDEVEATPSPPRTTASRIPPRRQQPPGPAPVDEEEEDVIYERRLPSSVRRYRPTVRTSQPVRGAGARGGLTRKLVMVLCLLTGIGLAVYAPPIWQGWMDSWHYGFPRTSQIDANVGHGTSKAPLTHFIAINNHGLLEVVELPTGGLSVGDIHVYTIAQMDGPQASLDPVTLTFQDVNGDGKPDMIVHCNGNEYVFYNDGQIFKKP